MASCEMIDEIHYYADPRLEVAVNSAYEEAAKRGLVYTKDRITFRISDTDIDGNKLTSTGLCEKKGTFTFITVNDALFKRGSPDKLALEYIVIHEFGHYIGRSHVNGYSIMNPNAYAGEYHNDPYQREKLIDELFE